MQPAAIVLMIAGFVFAFFSVPVNLGGLQGFDLLMDPVGWLLVMNGLRGLKPGKKAFRVEKLLCLALVMVGVLLLILGSISAAQQVLPLLGAVLQLLLYGLLSVSMVRMLKHSAFFAVALRAVLWLNAAVTLFGLVLWLAGDGVPAMVGSASDILLVVAHVALLVLLAMLLLPSKRKRTGIQSPVPMAGRAGEQAAPAKGHGPPDEGE